MKSQWDCLLQNLGAWEGSFTRLSSQGELLEETPTIVSLEGLNNNKTIRQIVRRMPPNQPVDEKVLEYNSLARSSLFFENGAFSQGSIQFAPLAEFGAELGLIEGDRRLRLVQLFNQEGRLDRLTLIRERRAGTHAPERPPLILDDLLGEWEGEAVTLYPDWRSLDTYSTALKVQRQGRDQIVQNLSFGQGKIISSAATVHGSILSFNQGSQPVQILLLPDGASSTCPVQIQTRQPFFLEVGWLLQSNIRQRLIRSYSNKGEWISLTLLTERKASSLRM
jgi:Domain of unknown function (DUF3598)